jgi:hypothetical protein
MSAPNSHGDRVEPSMDESVTMDEVISIVDLLPDTEEYQRLIALQGRTIAALQQRVFTLEMEIVEMIASAEDAK